MANSFIQVAPDSTGKKMQTFENVISGQTVEAEAVALVDNTGTFLSSVNVVIDAANSTLDVRLRPDSVNLVAPINATTTAYVSNLLIKAGSGNLFSLTGYNSK